jgi:hypothetical protein
MGRPIGATSSVFETSRAFVPPCARSLFTERVAALGPVTPDRVCQTRPAGTLAAEYQDTARAMPIAESREMLGSEPSAIFKTIIIA